MILVVGATGLLGMAICQQLRQKGLAVRAFVRAGSPREPALRALGIDIATGDLTDSATIDAACTGVTTVVSTATGMGSRRRGDSLRAIDRAGQLALVTAAKRCGVQRFVYMSISPNFGSVAPLPRYKREVERAVVASGMRYTILQPSAFMEVWLGPLLKWDLKAGTGQIFGKGDRPMSLISIDDVAAFSVIGATDPRAANRVIPLGGPQAITPVEVVRIFESVTGKTFRITHVPEVILRIVRTVAAPFSEQAASGAALGAQAAAGDVIEMDATLREFPMHMTTVEEFCRRAVGA